MSRLKSFREDQSGSALAEFLIVLPVLLLLMVGSFHVGYYVMYYHSVEKAARNGARYLARVPQGGVNGWGTTNAQSLMLTGGLPADGLPPLLAGWDDPATISVTVSPDPVPAMPTRLTWVRVSATVPVDIPVLAAFGFEDVISVQATHQERHIGE